MAYNRLNKETGSTPEERAREARDILYNNRLVEYTEIMRDYEAEFVNNIDELLENESLGDTADITPNRLFWLRDLKGKYVD